MSWLRRATGHRVIALTDQAVVSGATFVSAALVARATVPSQYGAYTLVMSALFVAINLQSAAVTTPYNYRRHSLTADEQRGYAGSVLCSQLAFAATVALLFFLAAALTNWRHAGATSPLAPVLQAVGFAGGAYMVRECCRQLAFAHERVRSALRLDVATATLQLSGLAVLYARGATTASRALLVLGAAAALPAAVWLVGNRAMFRVEPARWRTDALGSWKSGRWLIAGVAAHFAAKDLYPWLLEATRDVQTVALFAAAAGVALLINPAIVGIGNTLSASYAREVAERGEAGLRARVRRDSRTAVQCMIAYVAFLAIVGGWMSRMIYGAHYASNGALVTLIALSLAASVATMPIGLALFALDRTQTTFTAVCVAIAVTVVTGIPLAARFGTMGVGVALCLANSAESVVKIVLYRRHASPAAAPAPEEACV